MGFNAKEFNSCLLDRNFTYKALADEMHIKEQTLKNKINRNGDFTYKDIVIIQKTLNLNHVELLKIFFE